MSEGILGNATGGFGMPRSFVIVDENGNELTAVTTEEVVVFNATPDDVKIGKIFASENGILEGKDTKTYRTTCGRILIFPGKSASIPLSQYDQYDYTELQCVIADYNTTIMNSVVVKKIVINTSVHNAGSSDVIATVTKNASTKTIDLNFVNDGENYLVVHYLTYRQEV